MVDEIVEEIYAKSYPLKTLKDHTDDVIREFRILKGLSSKLGINIDCKDWEKLEKACFFHDFGKANTFFQSRIRNFNRVEKSSSHCEIPHNFLSLYFVNEEDDTLLKMIAFHHWRDFPDLKSTDLAMKCKEDLKRYVEKLREYFNMDISLVLPAEFKKRMEKLKTYYRSRINGSLDLEGEAKLIILLGFLNRLDHAASAGVPVELEPVDKFGKVKDFLLKKIEKPWQLEQLRQLEETGVDYKNRNGIIVASTGMGKTEMALLWSDSHKTFYTLPVRTSVNAMYERLSKLVGVNNVGILHSEALSELLTRSSFYDTDDAFFHHDMAKNLSFPVIVSTSDQVFSATLKYFGFEKIYSTLSYSKVVIDEIQAYSPHTMAIIAYGLKEISALGGKFLIVTATFPTFLKNKMKEDNMEFGFFVEKIPKIKKHRISLVHDPIDSKIVGILESLTRKGVQKILIVCNTVGKAQQIYKILKESNYAPVLLHSRFTRIDRKSKEERVLSANFEGILIATQVVEVSLDIDFDALLTEIAPLDVLVQRMGRVFRRYKEDGEYYPSFPNVYIFTENVSGLGSVYEKELVERSKPFLEKVVRSSEGVISEEEKHKFVEEFYSEDNLKHTKYMADFDLAWNSIKSYSVNTKYKAVEIFRSISEVQIIPRGLLNREVENERVLSELKVEKAPFVDILNKVRVKDNKDKLWIMELVKDLMVPIRLSNLKQVKYSPLADFVSKNETVKEFLRDVKVIDECVYDEEMGLSYSEESKNIVD